jgi:bifunctional non-homologous end joining protein LigD
MHIFLPLERVHRFDDVREFMHSLAQRVCAEEPGVVSLGYEAASREELVLIDYAQNARGKNTVAPYSVRPGPGAPVSAPIRWDELDDQSLRSDSWSIRTTLSRLEREGDLWETSNRNRQRLPGVEVFED